MRLAPSCGSRADRCNHLIHPSAGLRIVHNRAGPRPTQTGAVGRLDNPGVTTKNIGETARSDVIMIATLVIVMPITDIQGTLTLQILGHHPRLFVRTINGKPVKGKTNHRRMLFPIVGKRRFHTTGVLVIVINSSRRRMPAAGIKPDFRIPFDRVHPSRLEGIEEHDAI